MYHTSLLSLSLGLFLVIFLASWEHYRACLWTRFSSDTTGHNRYECLAFIAIAQTYNKLWNSPFKCTDLLHRDTYCNIFVSQNPDFFFPRIQNQEVF